MDGSQPGQFLDSKLYGEQYTYAREEQPGGYQ
jgi:hypothetical protein